MGLGGSREKCASVWEICSLSVLKLGKWIHFTILRAVCSVPWDEKTLLCTVLTGASILCVAPLCPVMASMDTILYRSGSKIGSWIKPSRGWGLHHAMIQQRTGGPTCIHGYSHKYPFFCQKKIMVYTAYSSANQQPSWPNGKAQSKEAKRRAN
jgi:hypothetical protein